MLPAVVQPYAAALLALLRTPVSVTSSYTVVPLDVATAFGVAYLGLSLLSTAVGLVSGLLRPLFRKPLRSYGEWAIVTGGSEGIGLAYATELARQGLKIVLVSRSQGKLDAAKASVQDAVKGAVVETVAADIADPAAISHVAKTLESRKIVDIGVLVNNAGRSYPSSLFLEEVETVEPGLFSAMIALNCAALTAMTTLVVPGMKQRRRGCIVNIASAAGRMPIGSPFLAVYSGTKAYVDFLSRSLNLELSPFGIHVQCQSPYLVVSALSGVKRPDFFTPTPETYGPAAVADIGSGVSTVPYWRHQLQDWFIHTAPRALVARLLVNMHKGLRARFFKRRNAAAATADASAPAPASGRGSSKNKTA